MDCGQTEGIDIMIERALEISHSIFYELCNVVDSPELSSGLISRLILPEKRKVF